MKKWITIPIAILFVVYFIAIVEQNNIVGDLLSPILTFLAFAPVFYAFFWKEQHKLLKISGLFYALAIFGGADKNLDQLIWYRRHPRVFL